MKFQGSIILVVCLLIPGLVGAAGAEPLFRFRKDIDRQGAAGEEIVAAVLDSDVYAATATGFPDLRIQDETGAEVPYLLEQASQRLTERVRQGCDSDVISLREAEGKKLEIVVKLRDKAPSAGGLSVVSPLTDYEHRVKVFGSRGDGTWSPLVSDGLIFDYTRFMDVRNRDVTLPPNDFRLFRLEVDQQLDQRESPFMELARSRQEGRKDERIEVTQIERRPFRIDRIDLWRMVERESGLKPRETADEVELVRVKPDPVEKTTRVGLRSRREPLTGFRLETTSRNFSRNVRVLIPAAGPGRTDWQEIGHGTISRFQLREFRKEELTVRFAETRSETYEIVIENADNPPLEITSVKAIGLVNRLIFLAGEGHRYRLSYGSDSAEPPRYDTAAVLASLGPRYRPVETTLGPEVKNEGFRPQANLRGLLNSPVILTIALALMIVVLAWVLFRAGVHIKKLPEEEV